MKNRTLTLLVAFKEAHLCCKPKLLRASLQTIYISQQGAKSAHAPQEPQVAGDCCGGATLLVMWSAYRRAMAQRPTDVSIFDRIEREGIRRLEDERAKEAAAGPKSTGERRLNAAGPAFIAARYDATFRVESKTLGTESLSTFPKEEALS